MAAAGLSNKTIATRLDTPRQIVSKWRKRFVLARLPGLKSQSRGVHKGDLSSPSRHSRQNPRR
jgi:transposase